MPRAGPRLGELGLGQRDLQLEFLLVERRQRRPRPRRRRPDRHRPRSTRPAIREAITTTSSATRFPWERTIRGQATSSTCSTSTVSAGSSGGGACVCSASCPLPQPAAARIQTAIVPKTHLRRAMPGLNLRTAIGGRGPDWVGCGRQIASCWERRRPCLLQFFITPQRRHCDREKTAKEASPRVAPCRPGAGRDTSSNTSFRSKQTGSTAHRSPTGFDAAVPLRDGRA